MLNGKYMTEEGSNAPAIQPLLYTLSLECLMTTKEDETVKEERCFTPCPRPLRSKRSIITQKACQISLK